MAGHAVNSSGVEVDWMGNAVVPYLTPYRETIVELREALMPGRKIVELVVLLQKVVPTAAVVAVPALILTRRRLPCADEL